MLTFISIISLLFLLFICIKYPQYSLAVFVLIFALLPYNIYLGGVNLLHCSLFIIVSTMLWNIRGRHEVISGLDYVFFMYVCGILVLTFLFHFLSLNQLQNQYFAQIIRFLVDYIFIGIIFNHYIINRRGIVVFDIVLSVATLIVVLYAYYNYFSGLNPYRAYIALTTNTNIDMASNFQESTRGALQGRVSSTFVHPLSLGQFMLLTLSYYIGKLNMSYKQNSRNNKIFGWIIVLTLLSVGFLSGSRSALIPMFVCIFIYFYYESRRKFIKTIAYVSTISSVFLMLIPLDYLDTILSMVTFWDNDNEIEGSSVALRELQFESMFKILRSDIIWGRGLGYIVSEGSKHHEMLGYESIVFEKTFETGLVGLFLFIVFYILLYVKLVQYASTKRNKSRVHSLCLSFLICIIMTGIQYGMFIIYLVFYMMTMCNIYDEEKSIYKLTHYDSKNNSLLLAQ